MKIFLSLSILWLLSSCSSSGTGGLSKDFDVSYYSKSSLMKYELKIEINRRSLILNYKNESKGLSENFSYNIEESESENLYNYLKSNNINSLKAPPPDRLLDAPVQLIKVKYNNKSNSINFGTVKDPPVKIINLKNTLFELASKYNKNWKKDLDLQ